MIYFDWRTGLYWKSKRFTFSIDFWRRRWWPLFQQFKPFSGEYIKPDTGEHFGQASCLLFGPLYIEWYAA